MNFKSLFDDEDAVSPVIGVILMVAITVILAAVIGTFVLGLGDQVRTTAPSHNFDTDAGTNTTTFSSTGGQSVDAGNLAFQNSTTNAVEFYNESDSWEGLPDPATWDTVSSLESDDSVSAGNSVEFRTDNATWDDGDSITLVWEDQGQSSTMTTWTND